MGDDVIDGVVPVSTPCRTPKAIAAVSVTLASNAAQNTGGAGTDTLLNMENLTGSEYPRDKLTGNAGANRLIGGAGNDTFDGDFWQRCADWQRAGNDTLVGGAGNDTLIGGAGKDVLTGVPAKMCSSSTPSPIQADAAW